MNNASRDLTHNTLLLLFIGLLIGASFWILKPFLLALIWAIMIVVATWPLLLGAQSWLGGKRSLAVVVMIVAAMVILIAPITVAVVTVVDHSLDIAAGSKSLVSFAPRPRLIGSSVCPWSARRSHRNGAGLPPTAPRGWLSTDCRMSTMSSAGSSARSADWD